MDQEPIGGTDRSMDKKTLLQDVGGSVAGRIGRPVHPLEVRSLHFLMGVKNYQGTPKDFLSSICGVAEADSPRDVAIKIQDTVYNTATSEGERRLAEAHGSGNTEEAERVQMLNSLLADQKRDALQLRESVPDAPIMFYGIPGPWIPKE